MIDDLIDYVGVTEIMEKHQLKIDKYKQLIKKTAKLRLDSDDREMKFIYTNAIQNLKRKLSIEQKELKEWQGF